MIPGPFEYFSENGWSQKIAFYSEMDGPYLDIQIWFSQSKTLKGVLRAVKSQVPLFDTFTKD